MEGLPNNPPSPAGRVPNKLPSPAGRGWGWGSAAKPRVDAGAEHPHPALPLKGEET